MYVTYTYCMAMCIKGSYTVKEKRRMTTLIAPAPSSKRHTNASKTNFQLELL